MTIEKPKWTPVDQGHPKVGDVVLAVYKGVYSPRVVEFWRDGGGNAHYGTPGSSDGKGSQPATHWLRIPDWPK